MSKTAKQIAEESEYVFLTEDLPATLVITTGRFEELAQKYADQEMISFAKWVLEGYYLNEDGSWEKLTEDIVMSDQELLEKYKECSEK